MPSQTGSCEDDAMLWHDEDYNKNSQEDDLSMFADIEKPSQDDPTPLQSITPTVPMNWALMETWDLNDNATNREDIYDLNTPTRCPSELTFPTIPNHENTNDKSPTFTELVPRNTATPNLFTDVETPPGSPQFTAIKDEPCARPDENSQLDVLRQVLIAAEMPVMGIPQRLKIEDPPSPENPPKETPVNDKKMIAVMRKYRLTDDQLHALSIAELKKLCNRAGAAQDFKVLSKYRRTCMNRFYARKSRTNKATVTQNLEAQLRSAHAENRKLKQELARRDRTIAKYEKTYGRTTQ